MPLTLKQYEEVVQLLLMLLRKAIMVKEVGDDPPSTSMWKSLISNVDSLYKWKDSSFSAEMEEDIGISGS